MNGYDNLIAGYGMQPSRERWSSGILGAARTWAQLHHLDGKGALIFVVAWVICALLAGVGIPRANPSIIQPESDLFALGIVMLGALGGFLTRHLFPQARWLMATSSRSVSLLRLGWILAFYAFAGFSAYVSTFLLPDSLRASDFVSVAFIALSIGVVCAVLGGRYTGMLAPFILMTVFCTRLIPWRFNILFDSDHSDTRIVLAVGLCGLAAALYAARGPRQDL